MVLYLRSMHAPCARPANGSEKEGCMAGAGLALLLWWPGLSPFLA
jgi:hypothetical protein